MAAVETPTSEGPVTKIADLRPNMKNINLTFVVLEKFPGTSKTKEGNVIHSILVADASGCIQSSMFDTYGERLQAGDIARLKNGHCTLFKKALTLYSGKLGEVERIGEFTIMFNESLNMSKATWTQSGAEWTPSFPAH